jgi:hypothetical protein
MGLTEKQKKQIDRCVKKKIDITDDEIIKCITKSKPKKGKTGSKTVKLFFGFF